MFNWIKKTCNSLLRWVARKGYITIARLLIKLGADVNAKDNDGETALHCAAVNGHKKTVELLSNYKIKDSDKASISQLDAVSVKPVSGNLQHIA
ncbi:MAG: ankyrin repeat domain-containing protein [Wolbachia endosymbiont of Xenopsylla cheopis]